MMNLYIIVSVIGGVVLLIIGEWNAGLQMLLLLMGIDYIMGLLLAIVFHKSKQTEEGGLESRACFKGLCRKSAILACVIIANYLDIISRSNYIRSAVITGFCINESISIIENAVLMDIPVPKNLQKMLEVIKKSKDSE